MTSPGVEEPTSSDVQAVREIIRKTLGKGFSPSSRYIISIQGISTSGKSTMARFIHEQLAENGVRSYLLPLDSFYIVPDGAIEECFDYDFDNPASLNWDNIFKVIRAIKYNEAYIPVFKRTGKSSGEVGMIPNFNPTVVVIEGIYGFNAVSESIFNIAEFDPYNTRKEISGEFIPNPVEFSDFNVIKLHLTLCKAKALSVRIGRDVLVRNIPVDFIVKRFDAHVWPAAERWIWSDKQPEDIQIVHGVFNHRGSALVVRELVGFFIGKDVPVCLTPIMGDMGREALVQCSGECAPNREVSVVVGDSGDQNE